MTMGLRINSNLPGISALKQLRDLDRGLGASFEKLATGHELNRAADAPARVSIADTLRSEIASLRQTIENATRASNLLATADAAMLEVEEMLGDIERSLIFAQNTGAASPGQILAEQGFVDQTLDAIRRISDNTRFGEINLFNGESAIQVASFDSANLLEVRPMRAQFNPVASTTTYTITVTASATQATALLASSAAPTAIAASGGTVELRLTGPRGVVEFRLAAGATSNDMAAAVNNTRNNTGVYASGGFMFTEEFGRALRIRIDQTGGTGSFAGAGGIPVGGVSIVSGSDAAGTFLGGAFSARGNVVTLDTPFIRADVLLNPTTNQDPVRGAGSTGTFGFTLRASGLRFQIEEGVTPSNLGLRDLDPSQLGRPTTVIGGRTLGGFLSTLQTGGANDLTGDPDTGFLVTREARAIVDSMRGFFGSVLGQEILPARRAQEVASANLVASESLIRDADFAEQSTLLTRTQVLFQSTLSVLGQANGLGRQVLDLLGS